MPVAAVIPKQGEATSAQALRGWINDNVGAKFQRVREVLILDDFPRSAAGKASKRELRRPYTEAGVDRP